MLKIVDMKEYKTPLLYFAIFAIISNIQILNLENKHDNLYKGLEEIEATGTVVSDLKETEYRYIYEIKIENINKETKYKETCLLLYTPKTNKLKYGDKIYLTGIYKEATKATNYKCFDYREYLKQKNIYGTVTSKNVKLIQENNLNQILILFNNLKQKIKSNITKSIGEEANIAIGILLRRHFKNFRRDN